MQWIVQNPKLARMVGQGMFSVGGFIILCGLMGRAAMLAINQTRSLRKMPPYNGLSEAYPMFALWWVPEHFIGYTLAAILAIGGLYIALTAKSVLKSIRGAR
jgi:hypothetical protein